MAETLKESDIMKSNIATTKVVCRASTDGSPRHPGLRHDHASTTAKQPSRSEDTEMKVIHTFTDNQIQELHALYQQEWWTKGRSLLETKKCIEGSQICIGIIDDNRSLQGFARIVTDYIFKAFIFDLIVAQSQRGMGLGNTLVSLIRLHQDLKHVKHFELYCLPEMFGFYEKHGFSKEVGEIKLMRLENA